MTWLKGPTKVKAEPYRGAHVAGTTLPGAARVPLRDFAITAMTSHC